MAPKQVLLSRETVDQGVMTMKGFTTLSRSQELEPHNLIHFTVIIYKTFCLDVVLCNMNGAPNKARTHSCRFAS